MSNNPQRSSAGNASSSATIPRPPPLPAPRPLQRARDAASRLLGYASASRPPSPQGVRDDERFTLGSSQFTRSSSLGATQNATTSHRTGLEIHSLSINDSGSHAIIAGKEIFKTVKVEDGHCAEDFNLRTAIRSTPTQASGQPRQIYSIDIADVAWAKGDSSHLVAAATSSGKIIVYDLGHAGLQAAQLHEHFRQVHNVTFNPHRGSLLLSGSQDGTVRLWDLRDVRSQVTTLQSKRKYSGQSDGVRDVKWSPVEGFDFAFGTDNGDVQRWDMRHLKSAKVRVPAHGLACNTVDWHPDGKHILSASSDKTVRIFDVSTSRPRKAAWEIKTAFPVMNARWRPSCQSVMPHDNGAQQCTQIVTAYDREHPIMHVWDFRRPLLPFRELAPHPSAPADLLWHSQDLLWTVGREGAFIQTDVQHTSKVIDRCNLQAIDVSALGELSFAAQARQQRRKPKPPPVPPASLPTRTSTSLSTSPETTFLSRSWQDDTLDHSFLSMLPVKRQARSHSSSRVHGAFSSSSTSNQHQSATIKLDDILLNRKSFRPQQLACRGQLESHNNPEPIAFMASRAKIEIPPTSNDDDFLKEVESAFKANEDYCQSIGFLTTASFWQLVGHCTIEHLKERIALRRKRQADRSSSPPAEPVMTTSLETLAKRLASQHLKSPTQSPGTLRPVSTIAQQLGQPESTSNVPTPLARPTTSGKLPTSQSPSQPLPDPDKDEKLALPPSIASTHTSPPLVPAEPSQVRDRRLTLENLEGLQKLQPKEDNGSRNEMVKRWSSQPKVPLSLDPVDDKGVKIPPAKLEKHDSRESFQFLEESGGSRESSFPASLESQGSPTMQRMMVSERPSRAKKSDPTTSYPASVTENEGMTAAHESMFFEGSGTLANSAVATMENSNNTSMNNSDEDLRKKQTDTTDFAFRVREDPKLQQMHSKGLNLVAELHDNLRDGRLISEPDVIFTPRQPHQQPQAKIPSKLVETMTSWQQQDASPVDSAVGEEEIDLEGDVPWTLIELLQEVIKHYTINQPYPQMAAFLLLLVGPLLPRTHPLAVPEIHAEISGYVDHFLNALGWDGEQIPALVQRCFEQPLKAGLHPLQVESVLSAYHEQLLSHRLFDEAAVLRKLACPAYPAVYEDFLSGGENEIAVVCGQCGKPFAKNSSSSSTSPPPFLRCDACRTQQLRCPICWEARSAFETGDGGKLFSCCLACGHSGHAACLHEWFVVAEGGQCPTEGCLCACVAGQWREERVREGEKVGKDGGKEVRRDEWRVGESRAVEGVRGLV